MVSVNRGVPVLLSGILGDVPTMGKCKQRGFMAPEHTQVPIPGYLAFLSHCVKRKKIKFHYCVALPSVTRILIIVLQGVPAGPPPGGRLPAAVLGVVY